MPADSPPRSLEAWLEFLGPLQPPVDGVIRGKAIALLNQDAGSAEVARLLALDPAAAMLVFRFANQALARYDREAHTLDHAIGLLGVARLQALLEQAPLLAVDHPHANAYRQMLLRSRHAAQQAQLWAEGTGLWPAEEVFWSTLVAAAPLWLLRLEAGSLCEQFERLRARQGAIGHAQAVELLGCAPSELGAALAQHWLLPEMSRQSWQRTMVGSRRQWVALEHIALLDEPPAFSDNKSASKTLHELCHRPALVVALANALAAEADWDWQSRRCLRLLSIAATACRRPLATILANGHQVAATLSREADPDLLTPAARLLGEWRQAWLWYPPAPPAPEAAAVSTATAAAATPASAQAADGVATIDTSATIDTGPTIDTGATIVARALQRLRVPGAVEGTRAALELVLDALQRGAGLQRCAALLVRNGGELQTVLSVGAEQAPKLRQFRYSGRNNQLLTQLLGKPVCLRLNAGNRAKFWLHLPEEFRAAIGCDEFLLMAAFAGDRPVALLYADNAGTVSVDDRQHLSFKQLSQQLSACLGRLS
jgi:HD-like signal output (HDOD) protein